MEGKNKLIGTILLGLTLGFGVGVLTRPEIVWETDQTGWDEVYRGPVTDWDRHSQYLIRLNDLGRARGDINQIRHIVSGLTRDAYSEGERLLDNVLEDPIVSSDFKAEMYTMVESRRDRLERSTEQRRW